MSNQLGIIILAAGKGKRLGGIYPKVLFELAGRPLIDHVLDTAEALDPDRIVIVVGFGRDKVMSHFADRKGIRFAVQEPQLGTGHAVQQAEAALGDFDGAILILNGDVPLISPRSLRAFIDHYHRTGAAATVMTARFDDPHGYGRIIRNGNDDLFKIVEEKDATSAERSITEVNSGTFIFSAEVLYTHINFLTTENIQREYYITDMIAVLREHGYRVGAWETPHPDETRGVNTPEHLEALMRRLERS